MDDDLRRSIGAPARRALEAAGIPDLETLSTWTEADLAALHGVGPKAIGLLRDGLAAAGLTLADASGIERVEAYLTALPEPQGSTLRTVRERLRTLLPIAEEDLRSGVPAFLVNGTAIAAYGATAKHCTYAPMSDTVLDAAGAAIEDFERTKSVLRFPHDRPLRVGVLRNLVRLRLDECSNVRNGMRRDYYPDGSLKAEGKVRDGELHGAWRWWRQDGTLMRTGHFDRGRQVGRWETWNRDGTLVTAIEH